MLITSDSNLAQFAKVCSCNVISSDVFVAEIKKNNSDADEQAKINSINNVDEFKKLFGI